MTATLAVRPVTQAATGAVLAPATVVSIRVVPAPRSEPPSDEELRASGVDGPPMSAPLLPFDLPGSTMRADRSRSPMIVLANRLGSAESVDRPVPPSPARPATRLFLATCVEVIGGFRPMAQLRPLCLPTAFGDIAHRLASHPATTPASRTGALTYLAGRSPIAGRNTGAPPRAPRSNQTGPGERTGVRRVQICDVSPDIAEAAAVLGRRDEVWAIALRFVLYRQRWLCSLLEVI